MNNTKTILNIFIDRMFNANNNSFIIRGLNIFSIKYMRVEFVDF